MTPIHWLIIGLLLVGYHNLCQQLRWVPVAVIVTATLLAFLGTDPASWGLK